MTTKMLRAADGIRIVAETKGEGPITFVVVHGLTGHRGKEGIRSITDTLAEHGRVVWFDQRGHGKSSGASTLGYREPMDLDAAIEWARSLSDAPVVTVGFSLGATVVIRHAALATDPSAGTAADAEIVVEQRPDATVIVSGVAQWFYRETQVMDRLFRASATPWGRLAMRSQGVRMTVRDWAGPEADAQSHPLDPVSSAAVIRHPLLIVHGTADHYFPEDHAHRVFAATAGNSGATLWVEQGMGHAERATSHGLVIRIATWASTVLRDRA